VLKLQWKVQTRKKKSNCLARDSGGRKEVSEAGNILGRSVVMEACELAQYSVSPSGERTSNLPRSNHFLTMNFLLFRFIRYWEIKFPSWIYKICIVTFVLPTVWKCRWCYIWRNRGCATASHLLLVRFLFFIRHFLSYFYQCLILVNIIVLSGFVY
jgi:hypothetical protein